MIIQQLDLDGCFQIQPEFKGDTRGEFARTFCQEEFAQVDLNTTWSQMNASVTKQAGTVRGIHFQRPPMAEVKLIRCIRGEVWDVAVDLRAGSKSFGKWTALLLSAINRTMIYIPTGFGHGFQSLSDDAELLYLHSAPYSPEFEGGVNHLDADLGIDWPKPIINVSDRDIELPAFRDLEPIG